MELRIEKLVYGGEGLSRLNGEVIFTPFVLPGERVVAERSGIQQHAERAKLHTATVSPTCVAVDWIERRFIANF